MREFTYGVITGVSVAVALVAVAARAQDPSIPQPGTIELPFKGLNSSGETVFLIEDGSNGPLMTIGSGDKLVRIGGTPVGMAIQAKSGDRTVNLVAGSQVVAINANGQEGTVSLGVTAEEGAGMQVSVNSKKVIDLGVNPGKNATLRLFNPQGQPAALMGSNPAANGGGAAYFYDGAGHNIAFIEPRDGAGKLGISNAGGSIAEMTISRDGSGGKVGVYSNSGQVFAAASTAGQGAACAYSDKEEKCLMPKQ